jgi:hypothetical protein
MVLDDKRGPGADGPAKLALDAYEEVGVKNSIQALSLRRTATVLALLIAVLSAAPLWAADPAAPTVHRRSRRRRAAPALAAPVAPVTGRSLEQLQGQVDNLRTQSVETGAAVKQIQQAIVVAPPANASAPPTTVGQHVAVIEKDLGDIKKNLSDNLGIQVHGLAEAGYTYNANNPVGGQNQLRAFDLDANSFTFQQAELVVTRQTEGGVGFNLTLNFGKTAQILHNSTLYSSYPQSFSGTYFDPTQAYLTYTIPVGQGISVQAGKFVTLLGEEVIDTYNNVNFNISRSFLFTFGVPLTHTGIQAAYPLSPKLTLTMALVNGWDDVDDNNSGKTVEGQLAYNPTDSLSLVFNGIYGPEQPSNGSSKLGVIDPIATWHTPIKGLQLIGEYLYGHEDGPVFASGANAPLTPAAQSPYGNSLAADCNAAAAPGFGCVINHNVDWQGFAGYLVYDLNDSWESATRGEFFRDSDGARTGLRQSLAEVTETISYHVPLVSGLLLRAEYRHDFSNAHPFWSNEGPAAFGPGADAPLHTYSGQDTIEAQAVYTF